jgi:hypothetical protein
MLDGYDSCEFEIRRWITNTFLDCIQNEPHIIVVIALREESELTDEKRELEDAWDGMVDWHQLGPIELEAWLRWVQDEQIPTEATTTVKYLFHRHRGLPHRMSEDLKELGRFYKLGWL